MVQMRFRLNFSSFLDVDVVVVLFVISNSLFYISLPFFLFLFALYLRPPLTICVLRHILNDSTTLQPSRVFTMLLTQLTLPLLLLLLLLMVVIFFFSISSILPHSPPSHCGWAVFLFFLFLFMTNVLRERRWYEFEAHEDSECLEMLPQISLKTQIFYFLWKDFEMSENIR